MHVNAKICEITKLNDFKEHKGLLCNTNHSCVDFYNPYLDCFLSTDVYSCADCNASRYFFHDSDVNGTS